MDSVVLTQLLVQAAGMIVILIGAWLWTRNRSAKDLLRSQEGFDERIRRIEEDTQRKVVRQLKEAEVAHKAERLRQREEFDEESKGRLKELQEMERRIVNREESLDKRRESLDAREESVQQRDSCLGEREEKVRKEEAHYKELQAQQIQMLEEISGMSAESAKQELMARFLEEAKINIASEINRIEREAKEKVDQEAKKILALAVERFSSDHVSETTISVVDLPTDEMKGRILGREGRNIRALEMATGVDIIIDDTPEAVVVSGFDKIRRETARLALEVLVQDGRIHPGRIEDVVTKTKREIDGRIQEAGEQALIELGISDVGPELVQYLGRLRYRTSYSQNALMHSKEVAHLAGMMASEMRIDPIMSKRAGMFHDIGKSATHEVEGSHVQIGYEIAKRYNEPPEVLNAIVSHHEDEETNCIEAVFVKAADTLSAARPGARREMMESYIQRLEALESIAESFKGVEKCYAIQAGREIRVAVVPEEINDSQASYLARDIAKRIQEERTYPGKVLVTVIRETRHTATAR